MDQGGHQTIHGVLEQESSKVNCSLDCTTRSTAARKRSGVIALEEREGNGFEMGVKNTLNLVMGCHVTR